MSTYCSKDKEWMAATKYYCCLCVLECDGQLPKIRKWDGTLCLACEDTLLDEGMWKDIPGREEASLRHLERYPHNEDEIWRMVYAMLEGAITEELKEIKNNLLSLSEPEYVQTFNVFGNIEDNPEKFYEHYQRLAITREEQKECLAQLNTRLCDHCLIPCDFQYCNECDLIYNSPPHMIYMISKEEKPISNCTSESESLINRDSNSNNDDDNNGSSSVQNGNDNDNDSNSDSNSNTNYKQYIALPDLFKKQNDNEKSIMPERVHDTNAGFDLRYPEKNAIKLEPNARACIDLRIALEIPATTMVLLVSRSSLMKKRINIKEGIVDAEYTRNISTMLQNDSEKTYIIEPNKKIAQTIFLLLVKVASLVSVGTREELKITTRGIQGFGSTGRVDVPVNMVEKKIVGQGEIISTSQAISILLYSQYMLAIERKEKEQNQIFEAELTLCKSREIGLINLHIPAKDYSHIKIPIYNNTGNVIVIPAGTTMGYLNTEIENQPPNPIPDFPQLCKYVDITSQTIYGRDECYLLQPEQLEQINMGNLDQLQHMQLKMLLNNFNDIFANENKFGRTDIIQHQIKTGDTMPIKQLAYRVLPASHEIICQEIN
ncbi:hypothetical protein G9A89_006091 [Geosiphon pyriformis]|nr:hypothetical protein G9A89_006091 [Geosiphon pyriformis]